MARGRLNFRQRDLAVVVKTLKAAGVAIARVDVGKDGGFKIVTAATGDMDETALEAESKRIDEVINHVFGEKGPQTKKRAPAVCVGTPKPQR